MLTAVRVSSCLSYASSDVGTGRCRMSKTVLQKLSITRMGTVLTLLLSMESKQVSVLCTAWLDTSGYLDDSTICVDDAVVLGGDADCPLWVEAECKVMPLSVVLLPLNHVLDCLHILSVIKSGCTDCFNINSCRFSAMCGQEC